MEDLLKLAKQVQSSVSAQLDMILTPEAYEAMTDEQKAMIEQAKKGVDLSKGDLSSALSNLQNLMKNAV